MAGGDRAGDRVTVTPATAITQAVADAIGRTPTELSPLGRTIDADALNRLLTAEGDQRDGLVVQFEYEGVLVRVARDEGITVDVEE